MEKPTINQRNEDKDTIVPSLQRNNSLNTEIRTISDPELISLCKCLLSDADLSLVSISKRKQFVLSSVTSTEMYLHERRIPELIRFIVAKIMCVNIKRINVAAYVEKLLNECMLFRAGQGNAPVLFEERHLQAVVKSFDPGDRGWLTAAQVRRAYITIGLTPKSNLEHKTPTPVVLDLLRNAQEDYLLCLLNAGSDLEYELIGE